MDKSIKNTTDFTKKLITIGDKFFEREINSNLHYKWRKTFFYYRMFIPPNKLRRAQKKYAYFDVHKETALVLFDDNIFSSGANGFVITDSFFYYYLPFFKGDSKRKGEIPLNTIESFRFEYKKLETNLILNNATFLVNSLSMVSKEEGDQIEGLMSLFIKEISLGHN